MSSGLQLDVRHHIWWRRHLVNAYEVKAGMVFFAGWKLCDPCLSALEWFVPCRALCKCSDLPSSLPNLWTRRYENVDLVTNAKYRKCKKWYMLCQIMENTTNACNQSQSKGKGKEEYLYSTFIQRLVSRCSDMHHTVSPANYTMPAFSS